MTQKNFALITGASSGIGLEFAYQINESFEENIILVARRVDRLEKLKSKLQSIRPNKNILVIPCDLSVESERSKLWENIEKLNCEISILINNAGFGSFGLFKDSKLSTELKMINLNCSCIVDLTYRVLPKMIERNHGKIINVSSMASFQGVPFISTYSATKAFVTSFSLALGQEVSQYNIHVEALCPGPVQTEFGSVAGFPDKISLTSSVPPKIVATQALEGLNNKKSIVIPGILNWYLAQLNRFVPRAFASKIAFQILKSKFE
jgi:short-subunit dehydrogenase